MRGRAAVIVCVFTVLTAGLCLSRLTGLPNSKSVDPRVLSGGRITRSHDVGNITNDAANRLEHATLGDLIASLSSKNKTSRSEAADELNRRAQGAFELPQIFNDEKTGEAVKGFEPS